MSKTEAIRQKINAELSRSVACYALFQRFMRPTDKFISSGVRIISTHKTVAQANSALIDVLDIYFLQNPNASGHTFDFCPLTYEPVSSECSELLFNSFKVNFV